MEDNGPESEYDSSSYSDSSDENIGFLGNIPEEQRVERWKERNLRLATGDGENKGLSVPVPGF